MWQRIVDRPWILSVIALVPILWAYLAHFLGVPPGSIATGFLQYDQASYMADARQYADGPFHLLYGLPFSPDYNTPRIYFQPQTLFLGLVLRATNADPGLLYVAFGLISALVFFRVAIALYAAIVGTATAGERLLLPAFLWGGGAVVLLGVLLLIATGRPIDATNLFTLDPFDGYWMLNLGRNGIYSVEAYYHAVFLGAVLLIIRKNYAWALALVAVLSASHPFTGLQLALIVAAWAIAESAISPRLAPPVWFSAGAAIVVVLHLGYYLVLLKWVSPEYVTLQKQWELDWNLSWHSMVAAYGPVAAVVGWRLRSGRRIANALSDRTFRILMMWFAVSFLLANHELFIAPRQPLHFTHGYIWSPLFLMSAPTMAEFIDRLLVRPGLFGKASALAVLVFLLTDNFVWFARFGSDCITGRDFVEMPLTITSDEKDVFDHLNDPALRGSLVVSDSTSVSYLTTVYTPLRSWYSHGSTTPHALERKAEMMALFAHGTETAAWRSRPMLAVRSRNGASKPPALFFGLGYKLYYENTSFQVFRRMPEE
jgi:hypothetical protein